MKLAFLPKDIFFRERENPTEYSVIAVSLVISFSARIFYLRRVLRKQSSWYGI